MTIRALLAGVLTAGALAMPAAAAEAPATAPVLKAPPGWQITRVAGDPLVAHPTMAAFDDRGRLFVADNSGENLKADVLLQQTPGIVRLLEDADGDGVFDKSTVFADKLTFPQGACWHDGSLYVAAPPAIWKFTDTNNDGVADERVKLVGDFGFTGNAADVHGPVIGPDGRLWWCDGRHGHEIKRPDGTVMKGKAARIFRCKTDGTEVEVICGGGMDNPVEVAFTADGEPLFTVNLLESRPMRVDAIAFAIEGGVYPHADVIKEFKRTGDLLPPIGSLGWVAVSGMMRHRPPGEPETDDAFLTAHFNTHSVQRHKIERIGASFRFTSEDFLTSSDPDVHPTDVLQDADGSLLVIDTGGWFRIGCPTSQVAKPAVKGAIYRLRKLDAPHVADARGRKIDWQALNEPQLLALLDDARTAVRDRAATELAKREQKALDLLAIASSEGSPDHVKRVLWTLSRMESPAARIVARKALADQRPDVLRVASRIAGLHRDAEASSQLVKLLSHAESSVRREAAAALGRVGKGDAVPALLTALEQHGGDRFLEHALIYALIEINAAEPTVRGLADGNADRQKGALTALDQMDSAPLRAAHVLPLAESADQPLRQAAIGVLASRPEWSAETARLIERWLAPTQYELRRDAVLAVVPGLMKDAAVQKLLLERLSSPDTPLRLRELVLETLALAPSAANPAWIEPIVHALTDGDVKLVRHAVATAAATGLKQLDAPLLTVARTADQPADVRTAAYAAIAPRMGEVDDADVAFLTSRLDDKALPGTPREPIVEITPLERLAAARTLATLKLDGEQLQMLIPKLTQAGPMESPHLLAAFERSGEESVGRRLVLALSTSPKAAAMPAGALRQALSRFPDSARQGAEPLLKRLSPGGGGGSAEEVAAMKAKLDELEQNLPAGNPATGRTLFFSAKAACSTCHAVAKRGEQVGPDLSKIGGIRARRDLIESVVFPSNSFARGFETVMVRTTDDDLHTGTLVRESPDAIYLRTPAELRIGRATVKSTTLGTLSIMPQGLDAALTRQELADLVAYLESLK